MPVWPTASYVIPLGLDSSVRISALSITVFVHMWVPWTVSYICKRLLRSKERCRWKLLLKVCDELHSVFAYVCNPNAIEIVAKGRVWPAALNYSNLKKEKRSEGKKKIKGLLFNTENFPTRVSACQGRTCLVRGTPWGWGRHRAGLGGLWCNTFLLHPSTALLGIPYLINWRLES